MYSKVSPAHKQLGVKVLEMIEWREPKNRSVVKSTAPRGFVAAVQFEYLIDFFGINEYYDFVKIKWMPMHFGPPMFDPIPSKRENLNQTFNQDALWMFYQGAIYVRDETTMLRIKLMWDLHLELRVSEDAI